jgi:hypothetical protein
MVTHFVRLNHGWNAHPNAPFPETRVAGDSVTLDFFANPFRFPTFVDRQRIRVVFQGVWRYGFSPVNDEGWYLGQCRFSGLAPGWREFYELSGDLKLDQCEVEWRYLSEQQAPGLRHFLFYLRDEAFECDATSWQLIA